MVMGGQGDHPHMVFLLWQEVPFVQPGRLPVAGHPLLIAPVFLLGAQAQRLKAVGVHAARDVPVPGIGAPLGEDRGRLAGEQRLKHGPDPVEQGLQGIDRVGAVLLRPEQLDQLRLGHIPVPVHDQIAKDIPWFLRAIDLVGQEISIYLYTETAQHRDRDRHPFRRGGWLLHVTFLPYFGTKRAADISSFFSYLDACAVLSHWRIRAAGYSRSLYQLFPEKGSAFPSSTPPKTGTALTPGCTL